MANISQTGLLFHAVHKLQIGTRLRIRVYLTKKYNLDCIEGNARIVWMNPHQEHEWKGYKYGLHITEMASDERDRLIKYFLMLQEEESSHNERGPFDNYEDYLSNLFNRKTEASPAKRGFRILNEILRPFMAFKWYSLILRKTFW